MYNHSKNGTVTLTQVGLSELQLHYQTMCKQVKSIKFAWPLLVSNFSNNWAKLCITGQGWRKHFSLVRQIKVEALYVNAGLENGLEWWNGVWNRLRNNNNKKKNIFIALPCSYLLTNLLIASPAFIGLHSMQPPRSCRGQRSHTYL